MERALNRGADLLELRVGVPADVGDPKRRREWIQSRATAQLFDRELRNRCMHSDEDLDHFLAADPSVPLFLCVESKDDPRRDLRAIRCLQVRDLLLEVRSYGSVNLHYYFAKARDLEDWADLKLHSIREVG